MKNLIVSLSLATLSLFAVGCKSDENVKPDYSGVYSVYVTSQSTSKYGNTNEADKPSSLTVIQSNDGLRMKSPAYGKEDLILNMDNNTFEISQGSWYTDNDKRFIMSYQGYGSFNGNKLIFSMTQQTNDTNYGYRSTISVRGTKQ